MPNTSNKAKVFSTGEMPKGNREKVTALFEGYEEEDSRRNQEIPKAPFPEFELHAYSHCYGD